MNNIGSIAFYQFNINIEASLNISDEKTDNNNYVYLGTNWIISWIKIKTRIL